MTNNLRLRQTLVAAQGSWRWQQRLRLVEYRPVITKDRRLIWGDPEQLDGKISGGNLRSKNVYKGARSRYRKPLTPCEIWASAYPKVIW